MTRMAAPTTPQPSEAPSAPADFLSPTGSITPAVAGVVVVLIANTLGVVFKVPRAWTALILSGILGALIVAKFQASLVKRAGYWVVNSLTIFAVAMGSNGIVVGGGGPPLTQSPAAGGGFWAPWL